MLKKFSVIAISLLMYANFIFLPSKAEAYSPIISSCSNGLIGTGLYLYPASSKTVMQLFEVRLDHYVLDAVGVRLKGGGQSSKARVLVIKRDGPVISSSVQTIPSGEAWAYVDLSNADIPRGVYYLQVQQADADSSVGWAYTSGECIADSQVMVNGEADLDKDMGFGIYAYDNSSSAGQPTAPAGSTQNGSSSTQSNSSTSSSNPTGSSSSSSNKLPGIGADYQSNGSSSDSSTNNNANSSTQSSALGNPGDHEGSNPNERSVDPSLTRMGPLAIAWFVAWGLIIFLIIWFLRRRKKKDSEQEKSENSAEKPGKEQNHEK